LLDFRKYLTIVLVHCSMVTGKIITAPDVESETVLFEHNDTPQGAYMALTDAVVSAWHHPDWVQVDVGMIPSHVRIGEATYDEESGKVTELELYESILENYGHRNQNS